MIFMLSYLLEMTNIFWVEIVFLSYLWYIESLCRHCSHKNGSHIWHMSLSFHQKQFPPHCLTYRWSKTYTTKQHTTFIALLWGKREKTGRWGKEMNRREKVTTFLPKCENILHTTTEKLDCELRSEVETAKKSPCL